MAHLNQEIQSTEAQFVNALVATDLSPPNANRSITNVVAALVQCFGSTALPLSIARFQSDFVIRFATSQAKQLVASGRILHGLGYQMKLIPWSIQYGATIISWEMPVAIDIDGFPPHTFNPSVLAPLLGRFCSIQSHAFSEPRGTCRVNAYTLSTASIPTTGQVGLQYPSVTGVCNVAFPVTLTTYRFIEAPPFPGDEFGLAENVNPAPSAASLDTAQGYNGDKQMLEEEYAWQRIEEQELHYRNNNNHLSDASSSTEKCSDASFHLLREYRSGSIESNRSHRW